MAKLATRLAARGTMKTTTIKTVDVDDYIAAVGRGPRPALTAELAPDPHARTCRSGARTLHVR